MGASRKIPDAVIKGLVAMKSGAIAYALARAAWWVGWTAWLSWGLGADSVVMGTLMACLLALEFSGEYAMLCVGGRIRRRPSPQAIETLEGTPGGGAVVIAVPMHLASRTQVARAVAIAEANLRTCADPAVRLAFLTDFPDSVSLAETEEELALLRFACSEVDGLNRRLGAGADRPVTLLHRDRVFVASEARWMGRDRKSGKFHDLCRYMVEGAPFWSRVHGGDPVRIRACRYALCCEEDTRLLRDALRRMAAFLDHPDNTPQIVDDRILGGHAIATPTVLIERRSLDGWRAPDALCGVGFDHRLDVPEVRDINYDLFGQSLYGGTGLFIPECYLRCCAPRLFGRGVLSHDVIEGLWLRSGWASGAVVTQDYPPSHAVLYDQKQRWLRGDLQNLAYLIRWSLTQGMRTVPVLGAYTVMFHCLSALSAAALSVWLVVRLADGSADAGLFRLLVPMLAAAALWNVAMSIPVMLRTSVRAAVRQLTWNARSVALSTAYRLWLSPIHACMLVDASLLVAWRLATGRRLLDWKAASLVAESRRSGCFARYAWIASFCAGGLLWLSLSRGQPGAALLCLCWMLLPAADRLCLRPAKTEPGISFSDRSIT